MNPVHLTFLILATVTIAGAFIVLWSKYVVHSAFGLMLSLLGIAGFYLLLGSDFLAVTQVIVYVGGVVVLYLFGIMLTPPDLKERRLGLVAACSLVGAIAAFYLLRAASSMGGKWILLDEGGGKPSDGLLIRSVGNSFMQKDQYLLAFELASVLLLVALLGAVFIARRRGEVKG